MKRCMVFLALALGLAGPALAREPSLTGPVLLAAAPELSGPYGHTVLLALPTGSGLHIGFILNRPTQVSVAMEQPGVAAAEVAVGPVYVGGPHLKGTLIALTRAPRSPSEEAVEVLPGLYMAFGTEQATQAAARFPDETRLFAGLVGWDRGELQSELRAGAWYVLEADPEIVMGSRVDTLWQRTLERRHVIMAGLAR